MWKIFKKKNLITTIDCLKHNNSYILYFKDHLRFPLRENAYCEIIRQIFKDRKAVIGSQRFEYYLWKNSMNLPAEKSRLVYGVDFCSLEKPMQDQKEYLIHFSTTPKKNIIDDILFFGSNFSLGNVIYGSDCMEKGWQERLMSLNKRFIPWYWLKTKNFSRHENEFQCIVFTSDSELMIHVSSKSQLSRVQEIITTVFQKHDIEYVFNDQIN